MICEFANFGFNSVSILLRWQFWHNQIEFIPEICFNMYKKFIFNVCVCVVGVFENVGIKQTLLIKIMAVHRTNHSQYIAAQMYYICVNLLLYGIYFCVIYRNVPKIWIHICSLEIADVPHISWALRNFIPNINEFSYFQAHHILTSQGKLFTQWKWITTTTTITINETKRWKNKENKRTIWNAINFSESNPRLVTTFFLWFFTL